MNADALREACDRNLTAAFASLVPHTEAGNGEIRSFGAVVAVATGLPIAFYNPVMVTDPRATGEDLSAAVGWIRALGFPASIQLRADLRERLESAARGLGLEPASWITPGMALPSRAFRHRRPSCASSW